MLLKNFHKKLVSKIPSTTSVRLLTPQSAWSVNSSRNCLGLFHVPTMGYKVKRPRYVDPDIIQERNEFQKKLSEYRKAHKAEYERVQREANEKYIAEETLARIQRHRKNLDRERTSIIKVAMHTKNLIRNLNKKEIEQDEKERMRAVNEMMKLRKRQMYLQAIQIDHTPPTPPATILNDTLYYERLQNLAFLSEQGHYEEVEKVLKNQELVDEKNLHLQPIYRKLKQAIRYITKTEEAELTKKYKQKIAALHAEDIEDIDAKTVELKKEYADELRKLREVESEPRIIMRKLERHITSLFHLIVLWNQYVEIIYLPEDKVQALQYLRLNSAEQEDHQAQEHKEYIEKITKVKQKEEEMKYQTVEEVETSDTGESAEEEIYKTKPTDAEGKCSHKIKS